jgi:hypothetical protein
MYWNGYHIRKFKILILRTLYVRRSQTVTGNQTQTCVRNVCLSYRFSKTQYTSSPMIRKINTYSLR